MYFILKHLNSSNTLSAKQLRYISNSSIFLQAAIIIGSASELKNNSFAKLSDSMKDKLDLFLAKLKAVLNLVKDVFL